MKRSVYAFRDPSDQQFFYVGASQNPRGRLSGFISSARQGLAGNKDVSLRILKILLEGNAPELVILEDEVSEKDWPRRERHWIAALRRLGHRLCNKRPGGEDDWRGVPREDRMFVYKNFPLTWRECRILERLAEEQNAEIEDLIREALYGYWFDHERRRGAAAPRDIGNDPPGDGGLPGLTTPLSSGPS